MLKSRNFWTSLISVIVAGLFTASGVELNLSPEQLADAIVTKEGISLIVFLFINLSTPIIKTINRIKESGYDWKAAVLSKNFAAHLTSFLAVVIGLSVGEQHAGFIVALVTQVVNFGLHILTKK